MERKIVIVDCTENESISVKELFGKDSARLVQACCNVMEDWLHPYKDCYIPKNRPEIPFMKKWLNEHPDEKEKIKSSRKEWEEQRDKQFRIVYGIAKRHHLHMDWGGCDSAACGDKWLITKNGKDIAILQLC